ncbi:hypothetical protein EJ07DRAFT_40436, partial [Lizonia empirigonia]
AIRIRDNQRRSRARRKDLIKDLQTRVQEFELKGVNATKDMQRAARKVAQENERLRTLLARHGVLRDEVDSFLRMCEQTEGSAEAETLGLSAKSPNVLQKATMPAQARLTRRHHQEDLKNATHDEISCETAATIIAQMRGDGDEAAAQASLGCNAGEVCSIKNSFLMQIMDE